MAQAAQGFPELPTLYIALGTEYLSDRAVSYCRAALVGPQSDKKAKGRKGLCNKTASSTCPPNINPGVAWLHF